MRIALDIDDTITRHPEFFAALSQAFKALGHEVYVITYRDSREASSVELAGYGIAYDEMIMATDEELDGADFYTWKAVICRRLEIDVFFEDMPEVINELDGSTMACMIVDPALGRVAYEDTAEE